MLNINLITACVHYRGRTATAYMECGVLRITIQPSGACLIEGAIDGVWYSVYDHIALNRRTLTNRMYQKNDVFVLSDDDVHDLRIICNDLRQRNTYDETLAPGPTFTGE